MLKKSPENLRNLCRHVFFPLNCNYVKKTTTPELVSSSLEGMLGEKKNSFRTALDPGGRRRLRDPNSCHKVLETSKLSRGLHYERRTSYLTKANPPSSRSANHKQAFLEQSTERPPIGQ